MQFQGRNRAIPLQDARSSPNQTSTALLTTTLVIWLYYHLKKRISTLDGHLEVTVTPLCVPLTIEHSTRFLLRTVKYTIQYHSIVRSDLGCSA